MGGVPIPKVDIRILISLGIYFYCNYSFAKKNKVSVVLSSGFLIFNVYRKRKPLIYLKESSFSNLHSRWEKRGAPCSTARPGRAGPTPSRRPQIAGARPTQTPLRRSCLLAFLGGDAPKPENHNAEPKLGLRTKPFCLVFFFLVSLATSPPLVIAFPPPRAPFQPATCARTALTRNKQAT